MPKRIDINQERTLQVMNQQVPQNGLVIRLLLDMTSVADGTFTLDLTQYQEQARFDFLQSIFIDAKDSTVPITVTDDTTQHTIKAKAKTQGWYNIVTKVPTSLTITGLNGPTNLSIFLSNLPIPGAVWATE